MGIFLAWSLIKTKKRKKVSAYVYPVTESNIKGCTISSGNLLIYLVLLLF